MGVAQARAGSVSTSYHNKRVSLENELDRNTVVLLESTTASHPPHEGEKLDNNHRFALDVATAAT